MACSICNAKIPSYLYCCDSCFKKEQGYGMTVKAPSALELLNALSEAFATRNGVKFCRVWSTRAADYYLLQSCDHSIGIKYSDYTSNTLREEGERIFKFFQLPTTTKAEIVTIKDTHIEYHAGWRTVFQFEFNESRIRVWLGYEV